MKLFFLVIFTVMGCLECSRSVSALDYPIVLLETRIIVDQPSLIRVSADWQVHLDRFTKVYELNKQSNEYAEFKSILANRHFELYKSLKVSSERRLSDFLKKIPVKHAFAVQDPMKKNWTVNKNNDESIDIAFRIYKPESKLKAFYKFKKGEPQYSKIEKIVGTMDLNSTKVVAPFFNDPMFEQLFTKERVFYQN